MLDKYHGWWKVQYITLKQPLGMVVILTNMNYDTVVLNIFLIKSFLNYSISTFCSWGNSLLVLSLLRWFSLLGNFFSVIEEKSNSHSVPHHNQHSNLYLREKSAKLYAILHQLFLGDLWQARHNFWLPFWRLRLKLHFNTIWPRGAPHPPYTCKKSVGGNSDNFRKFLNVWNVC